MGDPTGRDVGEVVVVVVCVCVVVVVVRHSWWRRRGRWCRQTAHTNTGPTASLELLLNARLTASVGVATPTIEGRAALKMR